VPQNSEIWSSESGFPNVGEVKYSFIKTNGINLNVLETGPKDGEFVLLLHGFPETALLSWSTQLKPLADAGYHVVAPDMRGYNKSDKPQGVGSYAVEVIVEDIVGLLNHFKRDKAAVIAHDWGAAIAWSLAEIHPERVSKLAILNVPHPQVMESYVYSHWSQLRKSWYIFFFQLPELPEWKLSKNNYSSFVSLLAHAGTPGKTFSADVMKRYVQSWSELDSLTAMINWYRAVVRYPLVIPVKNQRILMPTLILWGEHDVALDKEMAILSKPQCDHAELIFLDASHFVQHDRPEETAKHLLNFLKH